MAKVLICPRKYLFSTFTKLAMRNNFILNNFWLVMRYYEDKEKNCVSLVLLVFRTNKTGRSYFYKLVNGGLKKRLKTLKIKWQLYGSIEEAINLN